MDGSDRAVGGRMAARSRALRRERQVGRTGIAAGNAGDPNPAGAGAVGLRLGRLAGSGAYGSPAYRTRGDAGAGGIRICAPVYAGPGADPSVTGFAAQLRERAAIAEPPGAKGKTGLFGPAHSRRGA